MDYGPTKSKFIIMESQDNIREVLIFYIQSRFGFTPIRAKSIAEVVQFLSDDEVGLLLVGEGATRSDWLAAQQYHSTFFTNSQVLFQDISKLGLGVNGKKENDIKNIIDFLDNNFLVAPNSKFQDFTPVSITSLPYLAGIDADLYIQLPTKRHVKLYRKGDKIDHTDAERFLNKGVHNLYIKQACYDWILRNIQVSLEDLRRDSEHVVTIDYEGFKKTVKLEKELYDEVIEKSNLVKKDISKNNNIKGFLSNLKLDRRLESFINNRIKLISMISCGLAKELSWGSEETYTKFILAAHFHDILLWKNPILAMIKTQENLDALNLKLSSMDKILFKNHPEMTFEMLVKDGKIPTEVLIIISQHHELPNGNGFPRGYNHSRIKPFSALFIIALDLSTYILNNKEWKIEEFIEKYKDSYKGHVFYKIFRELDNFRFITYKSTPNSIV